MHSNRRYGDWDPLFYPSVILRCNNMPKKKIELKFTQVQIDSLLSIIETIEGMYGCADTGEDAVNWDKEMERDIRNIDRMLKSNGYKRG